ncbi:hypothetical protein TWF694_006834 [Orbilia ellipsospora]|uniref:Uncharacterized protein n=1 Tax=Orbilia ellipsospora TaxID=2528407 RepID=A0AAV9XM97_9PEZI
MANQLNRRISLSDIENPEAPIASSSTQPAGPLPPKYLEYKPGGREEFFKDLEAYQAAAQIYLQHQNAIAAAANSPVEAAAPSYDAVSEINLITIHETKLFRKRILGTLRAIRDFIERRRRTPKWSNCFGLTENIRLILAAVLAVGMVAGIVTMSILFRQVSGLIALSIFLLVHLGSTFFLVRNHRVKSKLIEALQVGLAKVEVFERIDDKNLGLIQRGIDQTLNPLFWIESQRRMEEAIPDETRAILPPPIPIDIPPPPLEDGMELGVVGYSGMAPPLHPLYTDTIHGTAPTALEMLAPRLPPTARRSATTPPPPSITPPPPSTTASPPSVTTPPISTTTTNGTEVATAEIRSVTPPPRTATLPTSSTPHVPISINTTETRSATPPPPSTTPPPRSITPPIAEHVPETVIPPPQAATPSPAPTATPPPPTSSPPPPPVDVTN